MDVVSHAGWGYATLRSRGKKAAWVGALAGCAPDLLFFFPMTAERVFRNGWSGLRRPSQEPGIWRAGGPPMPPDLVDAYNHYYVYTHSLVILAAVVGLLWLLKKRQWIWLSIPYALHILMDIPTHERYRTPFLYPFSTFTVTGVSWAHPWIFWPNWIALITVLFVLRRRYRTK
ncbi:MAG TPA: metal-dependent hydrolase [Bdellovibrionota bacterium]|nr:metal-dependent hydrolase [Bdellovibrionota bacterium]